MKAKNSDVLRRGARWSSFALLGLVLLYPGCSSGGGDESCSNDDDCPSGERCAKGGCVAPASGCARGCEDGERCVNDACLATCTSKANCGEGEVCAAWQFEDGSEDTLCSAFDGRFSSCSGDAECDTAAGFQCVEGTCTVACRSHSDCTNVGHCAAVGDGTYCVAGAPARPGGYFTRCPNGTSDCDAEGGFICRSAGEGDIDAYCTTDCASDDECPAGYRCGTVRVPPCENGCGVTGSPQRSDCAPASEIGPGLRYECGVLTAVRRVCERRSFCTECETDEDCLGVPGQICAKDKSGARICTVLCDPSYDSCPWGNAAECGLFDRDRGLPTCSHKFGSCRGTGRGCEPCTQDSDCGAQGICSVFGFSGERFCFDLTTRCDCGSDADRNGTCLGHGCPKTPGGLEMICVQSRGAGDVLGERCYGASNTNATTASEQAGCWRR